MCLQFEKIIISIFFYSSKWVAIILNDDRV